MDTLSELAAQGYELFCRLINKQELNSKRFQPDDFLFNQGQEITELYWLESGQFSVGYTADNGRHFSLGLFNADNSLLGDVELLTDTRCQFDVRANEALEAKVLPAALLSEFMQGDPRLAVWLSQSLSYKYQETMATTISRILHPLIYNIALDIEQRFLDARPKVNFAHVYKEAERFGCSERVYRRVVNQLLEMNLVEKTSNQLQVKDIAKLSEFLRS
ncbi:Crp/Fnr family transcriptional regulator [Thalassomonas viridans]|uniref:Crp/Fnr family transcriptional regulator n=1 Tax=Thalassomonas viridans TaxID=137584 RepID=A0AAE9Z9E0_9GAMM|nr:cyclic nucleotide-binding domain-containing protein [Thalassomonas viridans]WDE08896.1 Crp/Fnr family transcriptional regulator [Thalassomonas viridans]WDE08943.1 Crp/Fnr family transcriptional regulator [Thalassomonas viridans]